MSRARPSWGADRGRLLPTLPGAFHGIVKSGGALAGRNHSGASALSESCVSSAPHIRGGDAGAVGPSHPRAHADPCVSPPALQTMLDEDDVKVAVDVLKELEALMPSAAGQEKQREAEHPFVTRSPFSGT